MFFPGLSTARVVNVPADGGPMRLIPQAPGRSSFGVGHMDRLAMGSRAQLMPFIFSVGMLSHFTGTLKLQK